MLPVHIIHEILEQERKRRDSHKDELFIELPVHPDGDYPSDLRDDKPKSDRGVAIIDYFE